MSLSIPNPLLALPWERARKKDREARRLKTESAKLHRELGIAEDATFEEITEATESMLAKVEGDIKAKIRIEVAKDRIMQIRLNERLAGLTKLTTEAAAMSAAEAGTYNQDEDEAEDRKKQTFTAPPGIFSGVTAMIEKPSEEWRKKQVKSWGLLTMACLVLPPLASQIGYINWIIGGAQIMNRGVPEGDKFESMSKNAGKKKTTSFMIALAIWFSTKLLFGFLSEIFPSLNVNKMATAMETVWGNACLCVATLYLKTYKEA